VHQAVVLVRNSRGDAFPMKPGKQRGRASSVEAFVVIKNPNLQNPHPSCRT
jgi:hypothetical protein